MATFIRAYGPASLQIRLHGCRLIYIPYKPASFAALRKCKQNLYSSQMSQNEPNWQFWHFDRRDGQVLSDQNDGTNENISPNGTKGNEEAKQSQQQERNDSRFYWWSKVKKKRNKIVSYETKSDLNIISRYLANDKETRNIEAIPADELDTYLASSWQFANKMAVSRQICLRCKQASAQRYLDEQKFQRNILKDNEL